MVRMHQALIFGNEQFWNRLKRKMQLPEDSGSTVGPQALGTKIQVDANTDPRQVKEELTKSAKSAGFGAKIHQRPDLLCLTTKCSKLWTAILGMCEGDVLLLRADILQVKSELLPDATTTMGLGMAVVNFMLTFGNLRT
ncbi:hypothetical protein llap_3133 [Limosa lapponica baueri]|uniref:Uncharacterized protein n=1 Tax=Limosa lapponica baueri TaxID=1758121 RepID=A0A2I0UKK2_LIMLA|nr:hypothetical protein llap_3133 [Limosa lapponica baueri]